MMSTKYHIYWNGGFGGPVNYSSPVADVSALTWSSPPLPAGSDNTWAVHAYDTVTGLEDRTCDARVRVTIDGPGNDTTGLPGPALGLSCIPVSGGKARVLWYYQGANRVVGFHVYAWIASGPPNFVTPAGAVGASSRVDRLAPFHARPFSFLLTGLAEGVEYQVCARGYNASGESINTGSATVIGSTAGPAAVRILSASATV